MPHRGGIVFVALGLLLVACAGPRAITPDSPVKNVAAAPSASPPSPPPSPPPPAPSPSVPDDTNVSCFTFYYAIATARDLPRARACFQQHVVAEGACGGSSPSLDRLYLASMLVDAQGGPADAPRAEALFADCFHDVSVQGVLQQAAARSQPDPTGARTPLDFCKDIGGTTLSMGDCARVDAERAAAERDRVEGAFLSTLDDAGRALATKARDAFDAYVTKEGDVQADVYRGGSMSSNRGAAAETRLRRQRNDALAGFLAYKPAAAAADLAQAERALERAFHAACDTDAARRKLCATARTSWTAYRDAEVALYVHAHSALDAKAVTQDVKTTLTQRYAKELEDVARP